VNLFLAETTDLRLESGQHVEYRCLSRAAMADQADFHLLSFPSTNLESGTLSGIAG
jgi:hypothetical protein